MQVVVRISAQAIVAIASDGAGPDLGERNIGVNGASGGAGAGTARVEVRAIAVEPADEADRRLRACSLCVPSMGNDQEVKVLSRPGHWK